VSATDRHARHIVSALTELGVLTADGTRFPLRLVFPATLASHWMPGLFPKRVAPAEVGGGELTFRRRARSVFSTGKSLSSGANQPQARLVLFSADGRASSGSHPVEIRRTPFQQRRHKNL
jgi:hypothetical protein